MKKDSNKTIKNIIVILLILVVVLFVLDYLNITGNSFKDTGKIYVGGKPTSAKIYIDGQYEGLGPKTLRLLEPGNHILRVEKTGYKTFETVFEIQAGKQARSILYRLESA